MKFHLLPSASVGSVSYLNTQPLTHAIASPITMLTPRKLAAELHAGRLHAALVPLVEVLENPDTYAIVDGIAIGSLNEVYSVFLTHDVPLEKLHTVALDPDSKTSVQLARVLLENFHGLHPNYVLPNPGHPGIEGRVLIGDPALAFRAAHPTANILDLAGEWNRVTGLPFVFAVWAVRRDLPEPDQRTLAEQLRHAAHLGLAARRKIAQTDFELTYLTEHLHYGLGLEQKQAIALFAEHLVRLKLLSDTPILSYR